MFPQHTVSNDARYTEVVDKLKEYVVVHSCNQATVVTQAMEDLRAPVFTKRERPVRMYWLGTSQEACSSNMTKLKHNVLAKTDNKPTLEGWEHQLEVKE